MNKIAFIGAGNMNSAIISGMLNKGFNKAQLIVSDPTESQRAAIVAKTGINDTANNVEAANFADVIVLGVKPHLINAVCQEMSSQVDVSNKCFISIAAGFPIEKIRQALGNNEQAAIIRVMPNTPAQLGLGASGAFAASNVNPEQKQVADQLLSAAGIVKWVNSEDDIDYITAISGSGPAYFFLFMEAMQKQAQAFGFSEQDSRELVEQTALGAAKMAMENNELSIANLRENVTSKGGTTQAALNSFNEQGLTATVASAMQAALTRAQEMAKGE